MTRQFTWSRILAVRGESPASHRGPAEPKPRSPRARREEGEYREYSTHRGQRPAPPKTGCSAGRMQGDFHRGLLRHMVAVLLFGTALAVVGCSKSPTAPSAVGSASAGAIASPASSGQATTSWTQYSQSSNRPSQGGGKPDKDKDKDKGKDQGKGKDDPPGGLTADEGDGGLGPGQLKVKVDVCHRRGFGSGTFHQITVAEPALAAHLGHGDAEPGGMTSNGIEVGPNCEGTVACPTPGTFYQDADGDGFGDPAVPVSACEAPSGFVDVLNDEFDCNDADPDVNPGTTEVCDAVDNDCNTQVDEDPVCDLACGNPDMFLLDADGDGYGDPAVSVLTCMQP